MTTIEMEIILSRRFGARQNLIVPNVSWGLLPHEADLIVMSKNGYLTEVEIKISLSDLKKDKTKRHGHKSDLIKYLYFAIPSKLAKHIEHIPLRAGIIVVSGTGRSMCVKNPEANKNCKPLCVDDRFQLARLGALRIWGLKEMVVNQKHHIKKLKSKDMREGAE